MEVTEGYIELKYREHTQLIYIITALISWKDEIICPMCTSCSEIPELETYHVVISFCFIV
jgi:hypothetical protein